MADRDTRKAQEDRLFDLVYLDYSRGESKVLAPELRLMINRAKNGMAPDEIDAVYKRVKDSLEEENGTDK
jgi:hypothetical protein